MNALAYEVPVFNEELIEQFKPMITKFINNMVFGYTNHVISYTFEDLYQDCLIHLWTATQKYDPTKDASFSTYAYMNLKSRVGNFRDKVARHNTVMINSIETYKFENSEDSGSYDRLDVNMHNFYNSKENIESARAEILDIQLIMENLEKTRIHYEKDIKRRIRKSFNRIGDKEERLFLRMFFERKKKDIKKIKDKQRIFFQHYIEGKRITEIYKENPDLQRTQVNNHLSSIRQIYKTMINGETI